MTNYEVQGSDLGGWGVSPYRPKIMVAYTFISSSRFCPSLTGLALSTMHAGEESGAVAEMTLSLQVDLVLRDVAATVIHSLFSWYCYFAYDDAMMQLKCIRHPKNAKLCDECDL